jgi:hypothetical protein
MQIFVANITSGSNQSTGEYTPISLITGYEIWLTVAKHQQ